MKVEEPIKISVKINFSGINYINSINVTNKTSFLFGW